MPANNNYGSAQQRIRDAYRQYTGRENDQVSENEILSHLGGGSAIGDENINFAVNNIRNSDEARTFSTRGQVNHTQSAPPPATTPGPTGGNGAVTPSGSVQYGGYDFAQDPANRDPSKSAKYALAAIVEDAISRGATMPTDHAGAAAFANQYLVPGFQRYGYNISGIDRDRFTIDTRENDGEIIDWLVNAGGENPHVGWQSNVNSSAGANSGLTAPVGQLRGLPGGSDFLMQLLAGGGLGDADILQRINAEIQRLMSGQGGSGGGTGLPGGGEEPTMEDLI